MSLYDCVDADGRPQNAADALRDAIQRTVTDMTIETKYDEALEAFTEELRNGDREPPYIYPHGVSIDSLAVRKNIQHADSDKHQ